MQREAVTRTQADETLEQRHRELDLLNRASQMLSASLDLDEVLAIILEEVRHLMGVIASSVWMIDSATGELVCRQATGPHREVVRGWRLAPGEGIIGWVAHHGHSLIVPDALTDERHAKSVGERIGLTTRSILNVPLKTKQGVIGVLQVMDEEVDRFRTTDLTLLGPLAALAAIAIENVYLVEALRRRTAELEASNEELRRFTYVASHNLRAPLVNIQGFAGELRLAFDTIEPAVHTGLYGPDEEQQRLIVAALQEDIPEALGFIDSSVTQMNRLTNALLELSRLGYRELKLEPVDMNSLVQRCLRALSDEIAERQVKITVHPLPEVVADRLSMREIVGHLLRNAVTYLPADRPGEIEITAEGNRAETTFRFRDNGRGIAEEDMDKVFAPFRRAGKSDTPGQGMGLPYAQTLIRRHGGRIWCESEPNVGTMFAFTISNQLAKGNDYA